MSEEGFAPGARPICGFCNALWTDDMIKVWNQTAIEHGYYEGEVYGVDIKTEIDIHCDKCKRLIYRKEIVGRGGTTDF